jgi:hypothetical protein
MIADPLTDAIEKSLADEALSVDQTGHATWLVQSSDCEFEARLRNGRVLFQAGLNSTGDQLDAQRLDQLLGINDRLPGVARAGVDPQSHEPVLLADARLNVHNAAQTVRELCAEFIWASRLVEETEQQNRVDEKDEFTTLPVETAELLARELPALGWAVAPRDDATVIIELKAAGGYYPTRIAQQAAAAEAAGDQAAGDQGVVHLQSSVPEFADSQSPASQAAVALLLLQASHRVLGIKPSVSMPGSEEGQARTYQWRRSWQRQPTANEIHECLTALSIALQMTAREVDALGHPLAAEAYLASQAAAVLQTSVSV